MMSAPSTLYGADMIEMSILDTSGNILFYPA